MWRVYAFENGVLMLRNISTPFLNALGCASDCRHFRRDFLADAKVSPEEKHDFWCPELFQHEVKNGIIFEPIGKNTPKLNTTAYMPFYIYICTHFVELKTGPIVSLLVLESGPFLGLISFSPAERRGIFKNEYNKNCPKSCVKNWSNFVAQHNWTSF